MRRASDEVLLDVAALLDIIVVVLLFVVRQS